MPALWRKSGSFEFDNYGDAAPGALVYFYLGGTGSSPLTTYQDASESTPHEHPIEADGNGRWPAIFISFTESYDEKIVTAGGTQISFYESIPNPDPVEAAASTVDATQVLQTGDWKFSDVDETKTGFVRANGRTIGSATSSATERAHADCENLFLYRWNKIGDGQAAVSGGRGGSAAADWAANKTIDLPDCRGGGPFGLDTMGATDLVSMNVAPFASGNSTTPGSLVGLNNHTLTLAQTPAHDHNITLSGTLTSAAEVVNHTHAVAGTTNGVSANHTHQYDGLESVVVAAGVGATVARFSGNQADTGNQSQDHTHSWSDTSDAQSATHTHGVTLAGTFTSTSKGSGSAHNILSRSILGSWYIKL